MNKTLESVAVSSRVRLARNFRDYPFPALLMRGAHAEEQAGEMIHLLTAELTSMEQFTLYEMSDIPDATAKLLQERYLISRDLMRHRAIAGALISADERVSVMINEEDHIRAQYFVKGLDLRRAYERIAAIDEIISDFIPLAYDPEFGYLTACPTNLGTGLRASVMLFLPALSRRGKLRSVIPALTRMGLTVRGVYGEGSGADGDLFQVSNEVTLGISEMDILGMVQSAVEKIVEMEIGERGRMKVEGGVALEDGILRTLGELTHCRLLGEKEFTARIADVKLGAALGLFGETEEDDRLERLDDLVVAMRPYGIAELKREGEDENACRARFVAEALREIFPDF